MFKNVYYSTKTSTIHLWEQLDGENLVTEIPWTPYVFIPTKEEEDAVKTIYGKSVQKRVFQTYYEYTDYCKEHKSPTLFENNVRNEIQFLAERYYGIPDDEIYVPKLKVYYLDIEVIAEGGFPEYTNAKHPVVLASIKDSETGKITTFGYDIYHDRDYTGDMDIRYIKCDSEEDLLRRIFMFMHKFPCDVLSGYNIWRFDLPYMINRAMILWGEEVGKEFYSKGVSDIILKSYISY